MSKKVKSKVDLKKAAETTTGTIKEPKVKPITDAELLDRCPGKLAGIFAKAKTPGDRADFYRLLDTKRKELGQVVKEYEEFQSGLKRWFIENLPKLNVTGVTGKKDRVEIVDKDIVVVEDWPAFYAWVKKNNAFEMFKQEVKLSSAKDRWDNGKQVPGIKRGSVKTISLTKK